MKISRGRKAESTSLGKAIEPAQSQISQMLQTAYPGVRNSGPIAYRSDSDDDCDSVGDFTLDGKFFQSVFGSVVLLYHTVDRGELCCPGTVVDHDLGKTWILTSACLVRKDDTQFETYDHGKIKVVLQNGETVEGSLEMSNLHYNIAIVTVENESVLKLPAVELSDPPVDYSLQPRPVVAFGRDTFSQASIIRYGMMTRKSIELDCKELLFCTCDVTQDFVGGPVMDYESRFIGITYMYEKTAMILPVEIALRCMNYFKKEKTLPGLRIKGRAVHTLDIRHLESICCKFAWPQPSGFLVDKICDISTENYGGIKVGDIITELDGVTICSTAQFTTKFLDKLDVATGTVDTVTVTATVQRCTDRSTFVAKLNAQQVASDEFDKSYLNRWIEWREYGF